MALHGKATLRKIQRFADEAIPFKAGNVSGVIFEKNDTIKVGWLTPLFREKIYRDCKIMCGLHVFYSYDTPVAWWAGSWYMPPVTYTRTTTGHQSRIAVAIAHQGFYK